MLLLLKLPTFSQVVTANKDTLVSVPISQLRKAMYDLQRYDICKEETRVQDSLIQAQNKKIEYQAGVNQAYMQVDSLRVSQMQDLRHIIVKKDEKISILESTITRLKTITGISVVGAVLAITFF